MSSLLRLANKAASIGNKVVKHIDTANRVLTTVQSVADQHLQGTELHRKLSKTVGTAQGHLNVAHGVATHLKTTPLTVKAGGKKRKARSKSRKVYKKRASKHKSRRSKSKRTTTRRKRSRH